MTVAPRSASSPPANSPASVVPTSMTTRPSRAPPRPDCGRSRPPNARAIGPVVIGLDSRQPEHARRVLVEPLLPHAVLERQPEILLDQRLVRLPHEAGRQADQHLVLDQRVAELHQHFPAGAALPE